MLVVTGDVIGDSLVEGFLPLLLYISYYFPILQSLTFPVLPSSTFYLNVIKNGIFFFSVNTVIGLIVLISTNRGVCVEKFNPCLLLYLTNR